MGRSKLLGEETLATSAERPTVRRDIQGLRALAIVLVVLDHAHVPGCQGGFIGVDVFFVISGFVITQSLLRYPEHRLVRNLGAFYGQRIRRIAPAATLALLVTVVAAYAVLRSNLPVSLLDDVRWSAFFAENFRLTFTSSNYFIPGVAPSLVTQFWSLAVEEQFYLVYPLVCFTTLSLVPARARLGALRVLVGLAVVASAYWSWHWTPLAGTAAYYSPFTRFWELGLGGLVALTPTSWRWRSATGRVVAVVVAVTALVVLALATDRLGPQSQYPGILAGWPCGATAALLLAGPSSPRWGPSRWLGWRPFRYVGDLSYSLYLFHFVWLVLPLYVVTFQNTPVQRALEVAGALVCSVLSYHLVENPLRRSARLRRDPLGTALLLLVCLAITWDATDLFGRLLHVRGY